MKNLSKQVVILDELPSPYIHQAIIILKKYTPQQHERIIEEAEKVVLEYFNKNPRQNTHSIQKKSNLGLKFTVILLSIALLARTLVDFI